MTILFASLICLELQIEIVSALSTNNEFMALTTGIFDDVPDGQKYPYVSFGSHTEGPWPMFRQPGSEAMFMMDIWSDFAGDEECYRILKVMNDRLCDTEDGPQLTLPSSHLVTFAYDWSSPLEETDPESLQTLRHMPVRYHVLAHT